MAAQDHTLKIYVSENKSACSLIPVWPDLDVILVCRFDHGSISCCEMCLLKTQASRSCLACRPWLRHSGRMMFQTSAEPHIVALTKMEGRAKRRKEKKKGGGGGRDDPSRCWLICFSVAFCTLPPSADLHQEGSRAVMTPFCSTLACRHRCTVQPSGYNRAWKKKGFLPRKFQSSMQKKSVTPNPKTLCVDACGFVFVQTIWAAESSFIYSV